MRSGVSPPTLPCAIQRLEQELAGTSVYPDGKDSRLTALGRDIRSEFAAIAEREQRVRALSLDRVRGRRETLTLGVVHTIGPALITGFVTRALRHFGTNRQGSRGPTKKKSRFKRRQLRHVVLLHPQLLRRISMRPIAMRALFMKFFARAGERYATRATHKESNPVHLPTLRCHGRSSIPKPRVWRRLLESYVCLRQRAHSADITTQPSTRCWRLALGRYLIRRALLVAAPIRAKPVPATKQKTAP
jgi:DNA-binding transcriptional LysR family regulator